MSPRLVRSMLWLSLGVMVLLSLISVQEDFIYGHKGWCGARRAVAARNFVEHGFRATQFGPVENIGPTEPGEFIHYWHHPVGIHLLVGASFTIFGDGPAQARLVVIILSLLSWLLVVDLSRRWWKRPWGHVAVMWLFGSVPMLAHYGPFVNQEPLVLFCCVASFWLHDWFRRRPSWSRAACAGLFAALSAWSDWPWFLFAFFMALGPLWRVVTRRDREVMWLVSFSVGVLAGFVGVLAHLAVLQGNEGFVDAFDSLFNQRGGVDSTSFADLFSRSGPKWLELFTPTLVAAALGFVWWTAQAARRGALEQRHHFAWLFGLTGLVWVGMFRQGAWVHEYWAFYLAPLCVVAGAEVVDRVYESARQAGWPRAAIAIAATLIALQTTSGVAGTLNRAALPDSNLLEGEHWRHREVVLAEWLKDQSQREDEVALHDVILKTKFQVAYHLDRAWRKTRVTGRARSMPAPSRATLSAIDLRVVPQGVQTRVLKDALRRFRVSVVDDYLVAHLKSAKPKAGEPQLACMRAVRRSPSVIERWLGSMAYAPAELEPDPICEARLLLQAGYEELAVVRLEDAPPAETLRQHVTVHNVKRRAQRQGPDGAVLPTLPLSPTLESLKDSEHSGITFGQTLKLVGTQQTERFKRGLVVEMVLAVQGDVQHDWRPYVDRLSKASPEVNKSPQKTALTTRAFPSLATLKPGDLVYIRTFAGLNRRHRWHRARAGFWMPPEKQDGEKPPKGVPNRHLEVDGAHGITLKLGGF